MPPAALAHACHISSSPWLGQVGGKVRPGELVFSQGRLDDLRSRMERRIPSASGTPPAITLR
ncbi:hypothetical protein GGTG_03158 [Gaeumannomyces tritici R3-111a-1]|uniref:Uncharacterized protein n=1 Tax=Gaeumannomyces tritici (strain R3-111a-1) TaxID=644352 RepID=J3NPF0_GAET3|nr:hypothetical protein GGTG_03158 [Gaeumannomyces tritici R3-111a-1]EJT78055.1 hypothetical protein GGTG_03158 [Gaeumannomyces tritici R3-111a-1]